MTTVGVKHDQVVRYSKRKKVKVDYTMYDTLTMKKDEAFIKTLLEQKFKDANVQRYKGKDVTKSLLRQSGFRVPFLIPKKDGLGIMIPDDLTVEKVVELIGPETIIPVLDVHTQEGTSMKLYEWGKYWKLSKEDRMKRGRLNVISLEFSHTNLAKLIKSPTVVRELDWIELCWKNRGGNCLKNYPRVQYYCLMGVEGSYTDFHIDFGGTSVWYHIVSGEKWFYMIPPTKKNLKIYQQWSKSQTQNATFLPSIIGIDQCRIVKFTSGMTAMLPTGWIHAVYTPKDTLVIGGNFLHGLNCGLQLDIYEIEKISGVRDKFSFPNYERMQFYALEYYGAILDGETCIDGKEGTMPTHRLSSPESILKSKDNINVKNALDKIWGAHLLNVYAPAGWEEEEEEDISWNRFSTGYSVTDEFDNWIARRKYLWKNQVTLRQKFKVANAMKAKDKKLMNKHFLDFIQLEDDAHARVVNWLQHRKNKWWNYHWRRKRTAVKESKTEITKTSLSAIKDEPKFVKKNTDGLAPLILSPSSSPSSLPPPSINICTGKSSSTTTTTTNSSNANSKKHEDQSNDTNKIHKNLQKEKKILRVPTNYQLFVRENRNIIKNQMLQEKHEAESKMSASNFNVKPDADNSEKPELRLHLLVTQRLGEIWRSMSVEQKHKFTIKRNEIVKQYMDEGVEFTTGNRKRQKKNPQKKKQASLKTKKTSSTTPAKVTDTGLNTITNYDSNNDIIQDMDAKYKRAYLLGNNNRVNQLCNMLDETEILSKYELESLITFCNHISNNWKIPGTKKQKEYIFENLEHIPLLCLEKFFLFDESKIASIEFETEYGTYEL